MNNLHQCVITSVRSHAPTQLLYLTRLVPRNAQLPHDCLLLPGEHCAPCKVWLLVAPTSFSALLPAVTVRCKRNCSLLACAALTMCMPCVNAPNALSSPPQNCRMPSSQLSSTGTLQCIAATPPRAAASLALYASCGCIYLQVTSSIAPARCWLAQHRSCACLA